jgi:hypothetical protein
MRVESISRKVRRRFYYSVPQAGRKIGLGRSQSYRAAELGQIPAERDGKFLLVPRKPWDREVKRLLRGDAQRCAAKPVAESSSEGRRGLKREAGPRKNHGTGSHSWGYASLGRDRVYAPTRP